jgi:hypothetical protein
VFPFQILLRALPPAVEAKLWKQVLRWPDGLQARVFAAAAWMRQQKHPFAPRKRSDRVNRLTTPNSTKLRAAKIVKFRLFKSNFQGRE